MICLIRGWERMMTDETDWSGIEHAYGPAGDIPSLLEALRSRNKDTQEQALDALEEKLYHQGHRYDATLAALPALIDVLKLPDGPDRFRMLMFLSHIAVQYPDEMVRETNWSELESDLCFNAVRDSLQTVVDLLGEKSEGVRAGALGLLANVPPKDPEPLRRALDDKSALVRGLAVLALGRWGVYAGERAGVLPEIEHRARKGRGNEKALAAIAWLQMAPSQTAYDAALKVLPKRSSQTRYLPFGGGSLFVLMCQMLADAPAELSRDNERLLERLRGPLTDGKLKRWELSDLVDACILAFFGESLNESSPASAWVEKAPEDLTWVQLELLKLTTDLHSGDTAMRLLVARGVPVAPTANMTMADAQRCYLGLMPAVDEYQRFPAPPDHEGTWPLYKWLRGVFLEIVPECAFRKMAQELDVESMLEVVQWLASPSNVGPAPKVDRSRGLAIAMDLMRGRRGIRPEVERTLAQRLKAGSVSRRQFPLVAYLSEELAKDQMALPAELDEHLGEVLIVEDAPWAVQLVRSIVEGLPKPRRDAVVGGVRLRVITTVDHGWQQLDGWHLLDLHSDTSFAIQRALGTIREWLPFYTENIQPRFRLRVLNCLKSLGDGVIPSIEAALETEAQTGDGILREFLDELRGSSP
ncbi:HEAT repeat domain-containing protein [Candidatus Fermentibacteria bacterium]|nr:HEAT repeat domain-containing protein [Candidatus Fermentibacteria bacterium]